MSNEVQPQTKQTFEAYMTTDKNGRMFEPSSTRIRSSRVAISACIAVRATDQAKASLGACRPGVSLEEPAGASVVATNDCCVRESRASGSGSVSLSLSLAPCPGSHH